MEEVSVVKVQLLTSLLILLMHVMIKTPLKLDTLNLNMIIEILMVD